jgi:hypothetical protein
MTSWRGTSGRPSVSRCSIRRDAFYAYGELKSVRIAQPQKCAFVAYTTREAAERAMDKLVPAPPRPPHCLSISPLRSRAMS